MPTQKLERAGQLLNSRNASLPDLQGHLVHYSGSTRREAYQGMQDLFERHPGLFASEAAGVIPRIVEGMVDEEPLVRRALCALLQQNLWQLSAPRLAPFMPLLVSYIVAAMTHVDVRIRADAVHFLRVLTSIQPSLVVRYAPRLLPCFPQLLADRTSSASASAALLSTLSTSAATAAATAAAGSLAKVLPSATSVLAKAQRSSASTKRAHMQEAGAIALPLLAAVGAGGPLAGAGSGSGRGRRAGGADSDEDEAVDDDDVGSDDDDADGGEVAAGAGSKHGSHVFIRRTFDNNPLASSSSAAAAGAGAAFVDTAFGAAEMAGVDGLEEEAQALSESMLGFAPHPPQSRVGLVSSSRSSGNSSDDAGAGADEAVEVEETGFSFLTRALGRSSQTLLSAMGFGGSAGASGTAGGTAAAGGAAAAGADYVQMSLAMLDVMLALAQRPSSSSSSSSSTSSGAASTPTSPSTPSLSVESENSLEGVCRELIGPAPLAARVDAAAVAAFTRASANAAAAAAAALASESAVAAVAADPLASLLAFAAAAPQHNSVLPEAAGEGASKSGHGGAAATSSGSTSMGGWSQSAARKAADASMMALLTSSAAAVSSLSATKSGASPSPSASSSSASAAAVAGSSSSSASAMQGPGALFPEGGADAGAAGGGLGDAATLAGALAPVLVECWVELFPASLAAHHDRIDAYAVAAASLTTSWAASTWSGAGMLFALLDTEARSSSSSSSASSGGRRGGGHSGSSAAAAAAALTESKGSSGSSAASGSSSVSSALPPKLLSQRISALASIARALLALARAERDTAVAQRRAARAAAISNSVGGSACDVDGDVALPPPLAVFLPRLSAHVLSCFPLAATASHDIRAVALVNGALAELMLLMVTTSSATSTSASSGPQEVSLTTPEPIVPPATGNAGPGPTHGNARKRARAESPSRSPVVGLLAGGLTGQRHSSSGRSSGGGGSGLSKKQRQTEQIHDRAAQQWLQLLLAFVHESFEHHSALSARMGERLRRVAYAQEPAARPVPTDDVDAASLAANADSAAAMVDDEAGAARGGAEGGHDGAGGQDGEDGENGEEDEEEDDEEDDEVEGLPTSARSADGALAKAGVFPGYAPLSDLLRLVRALLPRVSPVQQRWVLDTFTDFYLSSPLPPVPFPALAPSEAAAALRTAAGRSRARRVLAPYRSRTLCLPLIAVLLTQRRFPPAEALAAYGPWAFTTEGQVAAAWATCSHARNAWLPSLPALVRALGARAPSVARLAMGTLAQCARTLRNVVPQLVSAAPRPALPSHLTPALKDSLVPGPASPTPASAVAAQYGTGARTIVGPTLAQALAISSDAAASAMTDSSVEAGSVAAAASHTSALGVVGVAVADAPAFGMRPARPAVVDRLRQSIADGRHLSGAAASLVPGATALLAAASGTQAAVVAAATSSAGAALKALAALPDRVMDWDAQQAALVPALHVQLRAVPCLQQLLEDDAASAAGAAAAASGVLAPAPGAGSRAATSLSTLQVLDVPGPLFSALVSPQAVRGLVDAAACFASLDPTLLSALVFAVRYSPEHVHAVALPRLALRPSVFSLPIVNASIRECRAAIEQQAKQQPQQQQQHPHLQGGALAKESAGSRLARAIAKSLSDFHAAPEVTEELLTPAQVLPPGLPADLRLDVLRVVARAAARLPPSLVLGFVLSCALAAPTAVASPAFDGTRPAIAPAALREALGRALRPLAAAREREAAALAERASAMCAHYAAPAFSSAAASPAASAGPAPSMHSKALATEAEQVRSTVQREYASAMATWPTAQLAFAHSAQLGHPAVARAVADLFADLPVEEALAATAPVHITATPVSAAGAAGAAGAGAVAGAGAGSVSGRSVEHSYGQGVVAPTPPLRRRGQAVLMLLSPAVSAQLGTCFTALKDCVGAVGEGIVGAVASSRPLQLPAPSAADLKGVPSVVNVGRLVLLYSRALSLASSAPSSSFGARAEDALAALPPALRPDKAMLRRLASCLAVWLPLLAQWFPATQTTGGAGDARAVFGSRAVTLGGTGMGAGLTASAFAGVCPGQPDATAHAVEVLRRSPRVLAHLLAMLAEGVRELAALSLPVADPQRPATLPNHIELPAIVSVLAGLVSLPPLRASLLAFAPPDAADERSLGRGLTTRELASPEASLTAAVAALTQHRNRILSGAACPEGAGIEHGLVAELSTRLSMLFGGKS